MKVLNEMYDQMFEIVWYAIADPLKSKVDACDISTKMEIQGVTDGSVYSNIWDINNAANYAQYS
jgi:hypothetical protein